jgi:8-oxo-dGTP pyrophosphatase MutT (NUDIX family)
LDAVVVVIERPTGEILMIQRPASDTYPLYWNPVTGACEDHDLSVLTETCRREAMEEVGLAVVVLGKIHESLTQRRTYALHWFLARVEGDNGAMPPPRVRHDPAEVAGYCWISPVSVGMLTPSFEDTHRFFREDYRSVRQRLLDSLPA